MKSLTLLSFTVLILMTIGCDESPAQNKNYGNHQVYEAVSVQNQNKNIYNKQNHMANGENTQTLPSQNKSDDKIIMHTVMNPKTGQPSMYVPLPSSWKFIKGAAFGQPSITGPHGLTSIAYPPQNYIYANNDMTNQTFQSTGVQVMAPVGIKNILNQLIIPQGQQMGMTLLNQYPLPEVAAKDREYSEKLNGGNSPQDIFQAVGTDWQDGEGNKALVVLHYSEKRSNSVINWSYNASMLKAQQANFEQAKQQYVFAMSNMVFDQNDVNAFQNELAGKIKAQEDHARAMRDIYSKGSSKRLADDAATNEHIRNSTKEGNEFREHNIDVLQQQRNNALNDVNVVVSPFDGKEYQVESGNKTYWINDEGKYIKSDNPNFDPNKYEDRTGVWKKAPAKVYK